MQSTTLTVNGSAVQVGAADYTPLLDVLRNHLGLKGTKFGCGLEQCGCCMVLVDGNPEKSCGKSVSSLVGKNIVTIEGMGTPERPHPLQAAFLDEQAGQCGYCLPGILICAKALPFTFAMCVAKLSRSPAMSRPSLMISFTSAGTSARRVSTQPGRKILQP